MKKAIILFGIIALMVSCGPTKEDIIKLEYHTETVVVTIIREDGTILQRDVCTKMPNEGTNYEYALRLELGNLYDYWRGIVAYDVKAFTITRPNAPSLEIQSEEPTQDISIQQKINYKIKLPEHYTSITMDNNHPTDLTGFIRNDTIIINFKNY